MSQELVKNKDAHTAPTRQSAQQDRQIRYPSVDISERENEFVIEADMPGVREENIDIQFHQGELIIHGKVEVPQKADDNYRFRQFELTDFHRVFRIGESVESANISAHCTDGVLIVRLPKAEKLRPRKIDVARK